MNLQHLRRFAKPTLLPVEIQERLGASDRSSNEQLLCENPTDKGDDNSNEDGEPALIAQTLYLLVGAVSQAPHREILDVVSAHFSLAGLTENPPLHTIPVPATPPTSENQAKEWSEAYWPTIYKKHNPNGPHPSIVLRAEDGIQPFVGQWMALAQHVANESQVQVIGESFGAVIVNPSAIAGSPAVVTVACDARWRDTSSSEHFGSGNVMAHAVVRAIALVARKRRIRGNEMKQASPDSSIFLDYPLTPTEETFFDADTLKAGGYLCTGLEIYLTHEPCVMCSMAILHSRFDKVVFGTRMPATGGLTAEVTEDGSEKGGLGYGLFWLPELNWKLLAWEWIEDRAEDGRLSNGETRLKALHA